MYRRYRVSSLYRRVCACRADGLHHRRPKSCRGGRWSVQVEDRGLRKDSAGRNRDHSRW